MILVLAALRASSDQTLANMLLERYGRVPVRVVAGAQPLCVLRPGEPLLWVETSEIGAT